MGCTLVLVACSATDVVARLRSDGPCADAGVSCTDAGATGCQAESCATLGSRSALCQNGQSQIQAGDSCKADGSAQASRYALCTCSDLITSNKLTVDAFSGTLAQSATQTPKVGINGNLSLQGSGTIAADFIVRGRSVVGDDLMLHGLTQSTSAPCSCASEALLDVAALASAHASDNDNALAGITSEQLNGFSGAQQLTLDCGRYYFSRLKGDDPIVIHTRGHVAIFVGSNIELNNALSIQTESESQVSLFVAADMRVGGALSLGGDPNGKARVDLYLASEGTLEIAGSTELSGKLYAPRAELVSFGTFQIYGSLFVRRAAPGGELNIHYDELSANPVRCTLP
jgi:hypothetical protein